MRGESRASASINKKEENKSSAHKVAHNRFYHILLYWIRQVSQRRKTRRRRSRKFNAPAPSPAPPKQWRLNESLAQFTHTLPVEKKKSIKQSIPLPREALARFFKFFQLVLASISLYSLPTQPGVYVIEHKRKILPLNRFIAAVRLLKGRNQSYLKSDHDRGALYQALYIILMCAVPSLAHSLLYVYGFVLI